MTAAVVYLYRQGLSQRLLCVRCGGEHIGQGGALCPRCEQAALPPMYISPQAAVGLIAERRARS